MPGYGEMSVPSPDEQTAHRVIARLTEPAQPELAELRKALAIGERDTDFGLLEIDQNEVYSDMLGHTFQRACDMVEFLSPQLSSAQRRDWRKGRQVTLPPMSLGEYLRYELSIQKDRKGSGGDLFFRRAGETKRGFSIHKNADGTVALRDFSRGDTDVTDPEAYGQIAIKSNRWIEQYASSFNMPDASVEIERFSKFKQLGNAIIYNAEGRERTLFRNSRYFAYRAGGIAVAGVVLFGSWTGLEHHQAGYHHGRAVHKQEAEAAAAKAKAQEIADHRKVEAFDALHLHLPASIKPLHTGEKATLQVIPQLADKIVFEAPKVEMFDYGVNDWRNITSDTRGGVRHLVDNDPDPDTMGFDFQKATDKNSCVELPLATTSESTIRIGTTDPSLESEISAAVSPDKLTLCNKTAHELRVKDPELYIDVTSK